MRRSKRTDLPEKICNMCGRDTVEYRVIENAPCCFDCVPDLEKEIKKIKVIPNEKTMITNLLNYK